MAYKLYKLYISPEFEMISPKWPKGFDGIYWPEVEVGTVVSVATNARGTIAVEPVAEDGEEDGEVDLAELSWIAVLPASEACANDDVSVISAGATVALAEIWNDTSLIMQGVEFYFGEYDVIEMSADEEIIEE